MTVRTHAQIISDAAHGDPAADKAPAFTAFAAEIGAKAHQPRDWFGRDSIPPEWWGVLVDAGLTSLEELQAAAEAKKLPEIAERRATQGAAA